MKLLFAVVLTVAAFHGCLSAAIGAALGGIDLFQGCNMICTMIYAPVCGSDGKTYPSPCSLSAASCIAEKQGLSVTQVHPGLCKTDTRGICDPNCPEETGGPVCGSNGVTYSSDCTLGYAACVAGNVGKYLYKLHNGPCARP